jgi:hypothetical protein
LWEEVVSLNFASAKTSKWKEYFFSAREKLGKDKVLKKAKFRFV